MWKLLTQAPYRAATLALAVLMGACATPLPSKAPMSVSPIRFGSGEWRMPDQVFVVTDASGTMYRAQTFPDAKALTQSFVSAMPDASARSRSGRGYGAGLMGFGGEDRLLHPLSAFNRGAMAAAASDLGIMGDVDGFGGETPIHNVLGEIEVFLAGQRGPTSLVFFTDGLPDDAGAALAAGESLVESYRDGVCIHGVHVGTNPDGRAFLDQLSRLTGCGSVAEASALQSSSALSSFARNVFAGPAPAPRSAEPIQRGERIVLRGVNFDFDKADIRGDAGVILDEAASILNRNRGFNVRVEGYTDSTGPAAYNQVLSERRADSVRRYLVNLGVASSRLQTVGFGESNPIAGNDTRDGRALNRRVELKVLE